MSPRSRKRLLRYGIAVDLVIVITGVALLLPRIPAGVIAIAYMVAAALSAIKGGWRGGIAATVGGLVALLAAFHDNVPLTYTATFIVVSSILSATAAWFAKPPAPMRTATVDVPPAPLAPVVAFPEEKEEPPAPSPPPPAPNGGVFARLFNTDPRRTSVNLKTKKVANNDAEWQREPVKKTPLSKPRRPRILLLEKRRGTADAILPKLRHHGVETQIVERWVDAVDELFRFRPDAFFLDSELPDFDKVYKAVTEHSPALPIVLTSKVNGPLPYVRHAATATRPYDVDGVVSLARMAMSDPRPLLEQQAKEVIAPPANYLVICVNCHTDFDALEADWCSCLTTARTLVCTNCLTCFCKAPPAFKEKFWLDAPPRLFARKASELQKPAAVSNPPADELRRPAVMLVENDNAIQSVVHRVCTNLGYGFVSASNGDDGLELARIYRPNLILADAFLPKRDGRAMCRTIRDEAIETKTIVMTGLYADTKFRNEALRRFGVEDYLMKPVSITDLINLLQKHLEGVTGLPPQEDLHALHRGARAEAPPPETYEISCFHCEKPFDAMSAEWCAHQDATLRCPECGNCSCDTSPAARMHAWMAAPVALLERRMLRIERVSGDTPHDARHPLVLLIDADEDPRLIVKNVVSAMSYGFIAASDANEGLAMAREHRPDFVLVDALDARRIGAALKENSAKVAIMTGLPDAHPDEVVLPKPLAAADVIQLLKEHL